MIIYGFLLIALLSFTSIFSVNQQSTKKNNYRKSQMISLSHQPQPQNYTQRQRIAKIKYNHKQQPIIKAAKKEALSAIRLHALNPALTQPECYIYTLDLLNKHYHQPNITYISYQNIEELCPRQQEAHAWQSLYKALQPFYNNSLSKNLSKRARKLTYVGCYQLIPLLLNEITKKQMGAFHLVYLANSKPLITELNQTQIKFIT